MEEIDFYPEFEERKNTPYSIQAEQSVIGGLILDNNKISDIIDVLNADDFYNSTNQIIYSKILSLNDENSPFDVVTLSEKLSTERSNSNLAYLGELARNTPSSANIIAYANIVKEKSTTRKLIESLNEGIRKCYSNVRSESIIADTQSELLGLSEKNDKTGPREIRGILTETIEYVDKVCKNEQSVIGLPTGFSEIDNKTSGLHAGELTIIAARPSMGKTTLAMSIIENIITHCEDKILFFSLEMPARAIALRMLSSFGGVNQNKIRKGILSDADWRGVSKTVSELSGAKLFIDDSPGLSPEQIRIRAIREASKEDIGLIVVDYLQLIQVRGFSNNRVGEVSAISLALKNLSKELNVPVIALSQLNRNVDSRPNRRPVLSDLRDSGSLEQDADLVWIIYRDEVYNENTIDQGVAEIIIAKHRNGPTGTCKLKFIGELTKFTDL